MTQDGEMWRTIRKERQAKRHRNEEQSIALLKKHHIPFQLLDATTSHYRVGRFNYWPTTGKFYDPKTGEKGRGIRNLINKIT